MALKSPLVSPGSDADHAALAERRHHEAHCIEFGPMRIGVASVIAFTYFNVSGGPWGSEDIFALSSPFIGTMGILAFTLFFCIPQCLLTSELCCAIPRNGGYAVWVREAMGDFWGVQEVYWAWVSGVADAAVYPVLLCDTIMYLLGRTGVSVFEVWLWRIGMTTLMSVPTIASFHFVPSLLVGFAIVTAIPVTIFAVYGSTMIDPVALWQATARGPVDYGSLLNSVFWNLEGWDCIAACTAMAMVPRERTIPRGLFASLSVSVVQYIVVLLVAAGISFSSDPWYRWTDGALPAIGHQMGNWMSALLLLASCIGNAGMYLSQFVEDAYLLHGAAQAQIAPACFAKEFPMTQAPYVASFFQFLIISSLVVFDFSEILVFDNFFTGMAITLQFVSFFLLRWQRPDMERPFKVSLIGLLLFIPALVILGFMLFHCFLKAGKASVITAIAFALGTPYGFWATNRERQRKRAGSGSGLDELFRGL